MDHERRFDRDDRPDPPSEGVRIIGAEEAAEAIERGEVAPRRGDDELRYGDRPPPPASDGPRPVLRFPLGSSSDARDVPRGPAADPISEPVELPHWTQPPTGQVPQILPDQPQASRDEPEDWASFATSSPRWQDDQARGEGAGYDASWGDADPLGALDDRERPTHDDFFSFADLDGPGRAEPVGVRGRGRGARGRAGARLQRGTTRAPASTTRTSTRTRPRGAWPPASASAGRSAAPPPRPAHPAGRRRGRRRRRCGRQRRRRWTATSARRPWSESASSSWP